MSKSHQMSVTEWETAILNYAYRTPFFTRQMISEEFGYKSKAVFNGKKDLTNFSTSNTYLASAMDSLIQKGLIIVDKIVGKWLKSKPMMFYYLPRNANNNFEKERFTKEQIELVAKKREENWIAAMEKRTHERLQFQKKIRPEAPAVSRHEQTSLIGESSIEETLEAFVRAVKTFAEKEVGKKIRMLESRIEELTQPKEDVISQEEQSFIDRIFGKK